jgi:hypothetical protein
MVDNGQEGMSQGHSRPFLATAKGNMVVLVRHCGSIERGRMNAEEEEE